MSLSSMIADLYVSRMVELMGSGPPTPDGALRIFGQMMAFAVSSESALYIDNATTLGLLVQTAEAIARNFESWMLNELGIIDTCPEPSTAEAIRAELGAITAYVKGAAQVGVT